MYIYKNVDTYFFFVLCRSKVRKIQLLGESSIVCKPQNRQKKLLVRQVLLDDTLHKLYGNNYYLKKLKNEQNNIKKIS